MSETSFSIDSIRRIVTGVDANGRSTVAREDVGANITQVTDTVRIIELWTTPTSSSEPDGGAAPYALEPQARGTLFRLCEMAPRPSDFSESAHGTADGLHATLTVDYMLVLSGVLVLSLESGEPIRLTAGDVVIQRGTLHAWSVEGDQPAVFAAMIVDDPELH